MSTIAAFRLGVDILSSCLKTATSGMRLLGTIHSNGRQFAAEEWRLIKDSFDLAVESALKKAKKLKLKPIKINN